MVSVIENYAKAIGVVKSIRQNSKLDGYHQIELELRKSEDVNSFPNLAKADEGKIIHINIKSTEIKDIRLKRKEEVSLIVRKASGQVYFIK